MIKVTAVGKGSVGAGLLKWKARDDRQLYGQRLPVPAAMHRWNESARNYCESHSSACNVNETRSVACETASDDAGL